MEVPQWWLIVSGVFFAFGILSFIALVVLILRLLQAVNELQPRVERISERVEAVSVKVDSLASTVKDSVETVGGGAKSITRKVQGLVAGTEGKMQQITSILGIVMTGYQLFQQFQATRASKKTEDDDE